MVRRKMNTKLFASDESYKEMISKYTKTDGILAITMYAILMLVYYFMGVIFIQKKLYLGIPVGFLIIVSCIALVLIRKQKLDTIGFTFKNIKKSLLLGVVFGILFPLLKIDYILNGCKIISVNKALYYIFYFFIVVALSEEVIFRGYIQTRIYGLIKNDILAVIVTGFMFYAMHLPYQMPVNGMEVNLIDVVSKIIFHIIANFLYRKYNSLVAPTMYHGFLNWFGSLIR